MSYEKNDVVTVRIEDIGVDGEGIGKADGFTVFVKDAVPGDLVKALIMKSKKSYGYGKLLEILEASPFRVEPLCPVAKRCGGCQLQSLSYEKQLEFKEDKVRGHLERIGGFEDIKIDPIVGMQTPLHYRNKAQFPVGMNKEGHIVAGFYAGRTHSIIENRDCLLGVPENKEVLDRVISHMEKFRISPYNEVTGKGLVRHILVRHGFYTGEVLVCLVLNGRKMPHSEELLTSLREIPGLVSVSINVNQKNTNVILGDELLILWGKPYLTDRIGQISYHISPLSFFQVNPYMTEKLYNKVLEFADLTGSENVWDLYCGIGTISLFLAQKARFVRGIEIIPQAIENARENAELNGLSNTEFFVGKAEEVLPELYKKEGIYADVIVVDPPRKGCDEVLLNTMLQMEPSRIVYVSCDSATLARDLKCLCANGYEIKKVCPFDQFPMGVHVETVCLLSKLSEAKNHISVKVDMDEMDVTLAESRATYQEIQKWVQEKHGFHVTNLNIAQVKRKHGIIERENYNKPKSEGSRQPGCPEEKILAIEEAMKSFQMI